MDAYRLALILHLIGAAIWVGGHLVLSLSILPGALRSGEVAAVRDFEARYERIGIPALGLQILTGLVLIGRWIPGPAALLAPANPQVWFLDLKLGLLFATVALAAHARLRVVPRLESENLRVLAAHIVAITALGIGLLVLGVGIRTGGLV